MTQLELIEQKIQTAKKDVIEMIKGLGYIQIYFNYDFADMPVEKFVDTQLFIKIPDGDSSLLIETLSLETDTVYLDDFDNDKILKYAPIDLQIEELIQIYKIISGHK